MHYPRKYPDLENKADRDNIIIIESGSDGPSNTNMMP